MPRHTGGMDNEKLIAGYILRVAVRRNRWRISLHDIGTQQVKVFSTFKALGEYLEKISANPRQIKLSAEPFAPQREE